MARTDSLTNYLTDLGAALREKTGTSDLIPANTFDTVITNIQTKEDLTTELTTQTNLLTTQDETLESIVTALQNKAVSGDTSLEDSFMTGSITHYYNDRITSTTGYCLAGRSNLVTVQLPNVKELQTRACFMCSKLEKIELDNIERFYSGVFYGDSALTRIIIRTPTVATLVAADVFSNSAIASGTGYIFVPDELLSDYRNATNWSNYAEQIVPLSAYNDDEIEK